MRAKKLVLAAMTISLTLLAPLSAMAAGSDKANYDSIRKSAIEKATLLTEKYGVPSVQYALIDQGNIVISGQAGKNRLTKNVPLTADTIYGIGSTSKIFVAAAVMKLVDQGKLDLDQPLTRYIPDFKMKDSRYTQITPRMLLNHSSGIFGSSFNNALLFNDNDTYAHDHLLEHLSPQGLKANPGAYSVYSNDSFTLSELLVEHVSGMDFTSFIHKYFTEPLGMKNTKTPWDGAKLDTLAGIRSSAQTDLPTENYNVIGTGGMRSTAEDLVKFSQIFTGQAEGILSKQSVDAMAQEEYKKGLWPKNTDASIAYGLGWDSVNLFPFNNYGIQALTKGGDTSNYHSSLVVLPKYNLAAAVISSGGSSTVDQMFANELLLNALQEKGIIKERKPDKSHGLPVKAKMPQDMTRFAGNYGASNALLKVSMNAAAGEMSLSSLLAPDEPAEKYTYTADGSFVSNDGTEKYKFVVEKNGHTYMWSNIFVAVPGFGQTVFSEYTAEKLEDNPLSKDVAAAWKKRDGKVYFLINEKYSSLVYYQQMPITAIYISPEAPGYIVNNKIVGADKAISELQIPTMAGRDSMEFDFFTKDGVEYLQASGGYLYADQEILKPLYTGKVSKTTIQSNGYARWFTIPEAAAGKTITVNLPKDSGFSVYDEAGLCVNDTAVSGKNQVVLPKDGAIVFAGAPGAEFEISLK